MNDKVLHRLQSLLQILGQMSEHERRQIMRTSAKILSLDQQERKRKIDGYFYVLSEKYRAYYMPQTNRFYVFDSVTNKLLYIVSADTVDESADLGTTKQIKTIMKELKTSSDRAKVFSVLTALSSITEQNHGFEEALGVLEEARERRHEGFTMIDKTGRRYYYDPYLNDFAGEVRKWGQK